MQDRIAALELFAHILLIAAYKFPEIPYIDELSIVKFDDICSFIFAHVTIADDLFMQCLIVLISFFVSLFYVIKFHVQFFDFAIEENGTENEQVDMSIKELLCVLAKNILDGIKDLLGSSIVDLEYLAKLGDLKSNLMK